MKKILIPILTTAAIAPVATTMVACGSTISTTFDLEFTDDAALIEKPAFELTNAHITAEKKYNINIDLSKASDAALESWVDFDDNHFMALVCFTSNPSAQGIVLPINANKSKIILNGENVTAKCEQYKYDGLIVSFRFFPRNWKKTDKLKYEVVWTDNTDKGTLIFTRLIDYSI